MEIGTKIRHTTTGNTCQIREPEKKENHEFGYRTFGKQRMTLKNTGKFRSKTRNNKKHWTIKQVYLWVQTPILEFETNNTARSTCLAAFVVATCSEEIHTSFFISGSTSWREWFVSCDNMSSCSAGRRVVIRPLPSWKGFVGSVLLCSMSIPNQCSGGPAVILDLRR